VLAAQAGLKVAESSLVHKLRQVRPSQPYSYDLVTVYQVLAAQAGLKVAEPSLVHKLRQVRPSLAHLTDIEFLSPYCIANR